MWVRILLHLDSSGLQRSLNDLLFQMKMIIQLFLRMAPVLSQMERTTFRTLPRTLLSVIATMMQTQQQLWTGIRSLLAAVIATIHTVSTYPSDGSSSYGSTLHFPHCNYLTPPRYDGLASPLHNSLSNFYSSYPYRITMMIFTKWDVMSYISPTTVCLDIPLKPDPECSVFESTYEKPDEISQLHVGNDYC